jgi:hypothetical protein
MSTLINDHANDKYSALFRRLLDSILLYVLYLQRLNLSLLCACLLFEFLGRSLPSEHSNSTASSPSSMSFAFFDMRTENLSMEHGGREQTTVHRWGQTSTEVLKLSRCAVRCLTHRFHGKLCVMRDVRYALCCYKQPGPYISSEAERCLKFI